MSYQLTRQETLSEGVKRVAREELKGALRSLRGEAKNPDSAVHDARKRFKKLRAVLRLVQSDLGRRRYRQLDIRLRDAGRTLSGLRDAEVLLTTLDALAERAGDSSRKAFKGARASLLASQQLAAAQTGEVTTEAAEGIAALEREIALWPLDDHWGAVGPNLERAYGRGRKAFKAARQRPTDDLLHAWRKRVKDLWYHLRLLNPLWPQVIAEVAAQAGHLADLLGDEHDLAVLARTLTEDAAAFGTPEDIRTLLELIEGRRHELRGEAERLGRRLYAEKPQAFARRLERYWRVWRAEAQEVAGALS